MPSNRLSLEEVVAAIKNAYDPLNLDVSCMLIREAGARLLSEAIKEARVPLNLALMYNDLREAGAKLLAESLEVVQAPINLNLSSNNIGDIGAGFFAKSLRVSQVSLNLNLASNAIGDAGARLLAEAIRVVKTPLVLHLSNNRIGEAGIGFIAEAIKVAQAPLTLDLGANNGISIAGIGLLAEAIKVTRVPVSLDLSCNNIGKAGIRLLAEAIKLAQFPLTLNLYGNNIESVCANLLAESLKLAQAPINLNLYANNIGDAGVGYLAESLKVVRVPVTLDLNDNKLGDTGVCRLADSIKVAQVPINLYLCFNDIGEAGIRLLVESLRVAQIPISLDLMPNVCSNKLCALLVADAIQDNFVIDAGTNPSRFLKLIEVSLCNMILEQKLAHISALARIVGDYIGDENLAWIEVVAIRAVEGASYNNKYTSINYELLTQAYLAMLEENTVKGLVTYAEQMENDGQEKIEEGLQTNTLHYLSRPRKRKRDNDNKVVAKQAKEARYQNASIIEPQQLTSVFLNLLLSISSIKAVSSRLEIPQDYVDVPGDGLCFYHAVARQLGGHHYTALELQQMAINEIVNHLNRYEGFAAQYNGDLNGFLNYHLQRQEGDKGGWADNIMIQALANALERVIEVQLFDRVGNAIGGGPIVINPLALANPNALRLGNIDDLHFVARDRNADPAQLNDEEKIVDEDAPISWGSSMPNATMHSQELVFSDGSSFEFGATTLIGINTMVENNN